MRKGRFAEEHVIKILKEHAAGLSAGELCHKRSISDATFYKWRSRFSGMEVSEARRSKALEEDDLENGPPLGERTGHLLGSVSSREVPSGRDARKALRSWNPDRRG